jgi:hypothetical protein
MSPYLDLTLTSESLRFNQKHDALLSIEALQAGINHYLKDGVQADDPRVSPYLMILKAANTGSSRLKRNYWMIQNALEKRRNKQVSKCNSNSTQACGITSKCLMLGFRS